MHYIKDHPFTIDFSVLRTLEKKHKLKFLEQNDFSKNVQSTESILKVAVEAFGRGAKIENKSVLSEDAVEDLLSEYFADFIVAFTECYAKMQTPSKKN